MSPHQIFAIATVFVILILALCFKNVKVFKRPPQQVCDFAFLAHWVENWNWLLWFVSDLHRNPQNRWHWIWLWPVYTVMSFIYLFGSRAYDIVDRYRFGSVNGETALLRNMGWHFFIEPFRNKIKQRILDAVLELQEHTPVIGLGALTKAEWLTQGGMFIVKALGDRLKAAIVHGDTLTAMAVYLKAMQIHVRLGNANVFITGATSKIGRAVTLRLAMSGIHVYLYTKSKERFQEICQESGQAAEFIHWAKSLKKDGANCQLWLLGKAIPKGKVLLKVIPQNAHVVNFSVPNPISVSARKQRKDLCFYEGGLLGYNIALTSLAFTMRLTFGESYACHVSTILWALTGRTDHEVGPVDLNLMDELWSDAVKYGFFLLD